MKTGDKEAESAKRNQLVHDFLSNGKCAPGLSLHSKKNVLLCEAKETSEVLSQGCKRKREGGRMSLC